MYVQHGIDFEEVQALWADPALVEVPARTDDEPRWLFIGKIGEKHWSAVGHSDWRERPADLGKAIER